MQTELVSTSIFVDQYLVWRVFWLENTHLYRFINQEVEQLEWIMVSRYGRLKNTIIYFCLIIFDAVILLSPSQTVAPLVALNDIHNMLFLIWRYEVSDIFQSLDVTDLLEQHQQYLKVNQNCRFCLQLWRQLLQQQLNMMLQMENCESLEERQEPLLNTQPTKEHYLSRYMQQFYNHQVFINAASRFLLFYFLAHIFALLLFYFLNNHHLFANTPVIVLFVIPELMWSFGVFLFKVLFFVDDPHLIGKKRVNFIAQLNQKQLISIYFLAITILLAVRNIFYSKNLYLLIIDILLHLLCFRTVTQAQIRQKQINFALDSGLTYMKQCGFYLVPIVEARLMEQPFEIQSNASQKNLNNKQKAFKSPLKKYFKPLKRKQPSKYQSEQLECQLYSH